MHPVDMSTCADVRARAGVLVCACADCAAQACETCMYKHVQTACASVACADVCACAGVCLRANVCVQTCASVCASACGCASVCACRCV